MKWRYIIITGFVFILIVGGLIFMQKQEMIDIVPLFLEGILSYSNSTSGEYEIIGDSVVVDDEFAYLGVSPHTITGNGWITITLQSKQYTGDIDLAFATDTVKLKPTQALYYNPTDIITEKSYTCDFQSAYTDNSEVSGDEYIYNVSASRFDFTTSPNYAWCFRNVTVTFQNGTIIREGEVTIFERAFDRGDLEAKTVYWNETTTVDWQDVPNVLDSASIDFRGMNKVWYIKNFPVNAGQEYTLKIKVNVPIGPDQSGKYFFGVKRSSDTIQEAIANQRFYYIDPWYNTSFSKRINITFDNSASSEDLVDFPVLVKLNSDRIDYADILNAGEDIRFVDDDESTLLSYEIELWDEAGDSYVWVKVPNIPAGSTTDFIQMYYKNQTVVTDGQDVSGTWNSGYEAVYHLNEDPSDSGRAMLDSTSNNFNLTSSGSMTSGDLVNGQIGRGINFDGTDDWLFCTDAQCGGTSNLDMGTRDWTLQAWTNTSDFSGNPMIVTKMAITAVQDDYMLELTGTPRVHGLISDAGTYIASSNDGVALTTDIWEMNSVSFDRNVNMVRYINDSATGTADSISAIDGGSIDSTLEMRIGARDALTDELPMNGTIDEVRISNILRSADWIYADYLTQSDQINTYGVVEELDFKLADVNSIAQEQNVTDLTSYNLSLDKVVGANNLTLVFMFVQNIQNEIVPIPTVTVSGMPGILVEPDNNSFRPTNYRRVFLFKAYGDSPSGDRLIIDFNGDDMTEIKIHVLEVQNTDNDSIVQMQNNSATSTAINVTMNSFQDADNSLAIGFVERAGGNSIAAGDGFVSYQSLSPPHILAEAKIGEDLYIDATITGGATPQWIIFGLELKTITGVDVPSRIFISGTDNHIIIRGDSGISIMD